MKKFLITSVLLFLVTLIIGLAGCSGCGTNTNDNENPPDNTLVTVNYIIDDQVYETYDKPAGSKLLAPNIEPRSGYEFDGWYLTEERKEKWDFGSDLLEEQINLYGFWKIENKDDNPAEEVCNITFYDGDTLLCSVNIAKGLRVAEFIPADRFGYEYIGWTTGDGLFDFSACVEKDYTLFSVWKLKEYQVKFIADDEIVAVRYYTIDNAQIDFPILPTKNFYDGKWAEFILNYEDIEVRAEYTPITYQATFIADGNTVSVLDYTVEDTDVDLPEIPEKRGYVGEWSGLPLCGGDVTIEAVYTLKQYTATFIANGVIAENIVFTIETHSLQAPNVPEIAGYKGAWEDFELTLSDITVYAVYTLIYYRAQFIADGITVETVYYCIEDKDIEEPDVPQKSGYTAKWAEYDTDLLQDLEIHAIYTAIPNPIEPEETTYYVIFKADGVEIKRVPYTKNTVAIPQPSVPQKDGFTGKWEEYTLGTQDIVVKAIYTKINDDFDYKLSEDESYYTVIGYKGSDFSIVIPSTHSGKPVKAIGASAFFGNATIEKIELSAGITTIEEMAFRACTSLRKVTLPQGLTSIGTDAFNHSGLEEINLPDSITFIGPYAFSESKLKTVTLPQGITEISDNLFIYCRYLKSVVLSDTVKRIGDEAFGYCSSLDDINLKKVEYIGLNAFNDCTALTTATIDASKDWFIDSTGDFEQPLRIVKDKLSGNVAYLLLTYTEYYWKIC